MGVRLGCNVLMGLKGVRRMDINGIEVGKVYPLQILMEYVDNNNCMFVSNTIFKS